MRILFMGTPDFAACSLEALVRAGADICGVITREDKPQGRKMVLTPPPVKVTAQKYDLPVYQPERLKDGAIQDLLDTLSPELIVVVAYGKILPKYILDSPKYGCINLHGSLLPKYRGASPIQSAVLAGERVTGVSTMYLAEGMDEGDVIESTSTEIGEYETSGELFDRLMELGAQLLCHTVRLIEEGHAPRVPQDHAEASYCTMLRKEAARIDFSRPAQEVINLIRGMNPWPVAFTSLEGRTLKVWRALRGGVCAGRAPGTVLGLVKGAGIEIACGDGRSIVVTELQPENGRRMAAEAYYIGHRALAGAVLGA